MGMTVTLDRMIHTSAVHQGLGKTIGLESCCSHGAKVEELNPIELLSMSVASCMLILMATGAKEKGLDLTGAWAETDYDLNLKDYKITSIAVAVHLPCAPPAAERAFLEQEGHRCPVYLAVKDTVAVNVAFHWGSLATPTPKQDGKSCCCRCS
jgi:uncharacterized OsmC-like protein